MANERTGLIKLYFPLDEADWHGRSAERLWARLLPKSISGNIFTIMNSPFYAKGISFLDTVRGTKREDGGGYDYAEVIDRSRHSTYRLLVPKGSADFVKYWQPLEKLGCTYESGVVGDRDFYAVDVPDTTDIDEVYKLLEEGEKKGVWIFDEGHCGHKLK